MSAPAIESVETLRNILTSIDYGAILPKQIKSTCL